MNQLVFPSGLYRDVGEVLLTGNNEGAAVLLASPVPAERGDWRLLVRDVRYPAPKDYAHRSSVSAVLAPAFVADVTKTARRTNRVVVFAHTHLGRGIPSFSPIDTDGERTLRRYLSREHEHPDAALVLSRDGCASRILGADVPVSVVEVGRDVKILSGKVEPESDEEFGRQVLAFGSFGQGLLRQLKVGIVGLGGTGSVVAQQLAHLGVRRYVLVDSDDVDRTNLNRLVGATADDVGLPKVEVAARTISGVRPNANVEMVRGDVGLAAVAKTLAAVDAVFCCTDSHGSRAVLNQLAYQYLVPCFDAGLAMVVKDTHLSRVVGRVQMLAPTLACLACTNLLDPELVRLELMTAAERRADPYFIGARVQQPAVVSLNSLVSSLAVTMFLSAFVGIPLTARYQLYDGIAGHVRAVEATTAPACIVCSRYGALGRGNEWPLPARLA